MMDGKQQSMILLALAKAGAKWTPILRQETDANGVPRGEPVRIGCLLGLKYRKGSSGTTLRIDIPGTVIRTDSDRFEGMAMEGCAAIRKGDLLCIAGTRRKVLDIQEPAPRLYVLTLDE